MKLLQPLIIKLATVTHANNRYLALRIVYYVTDAPVANANSPYARFALYF